jgi:sigma54-dependent transcription regulator
VTMGRGSQEWDVWFPTIPMISQMGSYIYICI